MTTTCSYCQAPVEGGVEGCKTIFVSLNEREYSYREYGKVNLLTVDAHALQHPEIHGKKNNAFHLLSLCWLLEYNGNTAIGATPRWLQQYFSHKLNLPQIVPPQQRGEITVIDLVNIQDASEYHKFAKLWASSVWQSWQKHHVWARNTLKLLLNSKKH